MAAAVFIYCKAYDERFKLHQFKVNPTERSTDSGRTGIAHRIRDRFEELKDDSAYVGYFSDSDKLMLNYNVLSYVVQELARCSILDAPVDAKGMAYEEIVAHS